MPQETRKVDRRVARARTLRRAMTDAEKKLWWHLRQLPLEDGHFRRQATIGRYFADFASHRHKLVIEIDGSQHGEPTRAEADANRTAYLNSEGYRVLRFWNNEVLTEIDGIMSAIYATLYDPADSAPRTPSPSPPRASARGGRGTGRA